MRLRRGSDRRQVRRGATVVELAILLPFLCFLFCVAVDYARVFYFALTVENCARNGAYYASEYPNNSYVYTDLYGYKDLGDAITRDATNLSPTPTWELKYASDPGGPFIKPSAPPGTAYVQVTVDWTFNSITRYPGIPTTVSLSRSCVMQIAPALPSF